MSHSRTTELICLGDELLIGLRANDHLTFIGKHLSDVGLPLTRSQEISDKREEIENAVKDAWKRSDLVIITGGLGPTEDDRTRESVAEALGTGLVHNLATEEKLNEFFRQRGYAMSQTNLKQCLILEGAEVLENTRGTAPGQWFERDGKVLVLLPGPPKELRPLFVEQILPRLDTLGWTKGDDYTVRFRTSGVGESLLAERLEASLSDIRGSLDIAYCAHEGFVDVRLHPNSGIVDPDLLKHAEERCKTELGVDYVGRGEPDLACLILKHLRSLDSCLAVAESCTGGLLSSRFTDIAGASKVFKGGVVCYRNEIKSNWLDVPECLLEQHGAVSPEVAVAMANGIAERMGTDYALSITGFAGPEGGNEPVGTIYLGYVSPVGIWSHKLIAPGSRPRIKARAVNGALDFMRRKLQKYATQDFLRCMCV
jgi:nicotinamide-nucleotide amidase|tara:strand:- start:10199 stop:11476 length:1278 start_codon:yes stop_codon:yes gene_type:complete